MDDVLREVLQIQQLFALLLQLQTFAAQQVRQQARQVRYRQKAQRVADEPYRDRTLGRQRPGRRRNLSQVRRNLQRRQQHQSGRCRNKAPLPREHNAGNDDHQQVQRDEVAVLYSGGVHHTRDHRQIAAQLQTRVPRCAWNPAHQQQFQATDREPEPDKRQEQQTRLPVRVLRPEHPDRQHQDDHQQPNPRQPLQPLSICALRFHSSPNSPASKKLREDCRLRPVFPRPKALCSGRAAPAFTFLVHVAQLADQREQRQVHGDNHAAYDDAQKYDHDRFQGGQQILHRRVHFLFVKIRDLLQHGVHCAGLLADRDHLRHHARENRRILQRFGQRLAFFQRFPHLVQCLLHHRIARGSGRNVQSFQNGDAARNQRAQRPRKPRHGDLAHQNTEHRQLQNHRVHGQLAARGPIPRLQREDDAHKTRQKQQSKPAADQIAHADHDSRRQRQRYAQPCEQRRENRHYFPQQQDNDRARDAQYADRINQGGLHRALQLHVLFNVARQPLQNL